MTPLPKKKHTRSRSNIRRGAARKIFFPVLTRCSSCKKLKELHRACPYCGYSGKNSHSQ